MDDLDRAFERLRIAAQLVSGRNQSPQQVTDSFCTLFEVMGTCLIETRIKIRELEMKLDKHGLR